MDPQLLGIAGVGLIGGIVLLVRGFGGYRSAAQISDTSPSRIASVAVGEVLVSGVVEAAELTLVSPLQSEPCVYYRARIDESGDDDSSTAFGEETAVGFRLRDESGDLRVFPRGARFDVPARFDERSGALGETPPGLRIRSGAVFGPGEDREAQIAALLTVRPAGSGLPSDEGGHGHWQGFASSHMGAGRRARRYTEARIEPGDVVTVVGRAMPFDQLDDPDSSDVHDTTVPLASDPEIAADLAAARATGSLAANPAEAWGNAAIPGFGIGRPIREPELDEAATEPPLASEADAARFTGTFEIAPSALILAASPEVPLVIALGAPSVAAARHQREFLVGLLGAVVSIASAMAIAMMLSGGFG